MPVEVIVLNGGSSSGKTGIARCLQAILPQPWISLSVDNLVEALPPSLTDSGSGIAFGQTARSSSARASARSRPRRWPASPRWLALGAGRLRRCVPQRRRLPAARPRRS